MRVLVLSRNYPNSVTELLGLWVERLVNHSAGTCELKVIAPTPYCPPFTGIPDKYSRFRRIETQSWRGGIEVFHPRMLASAGYLFYKYEWKLYSLAIRKAVERIRSDFRFDLIHAHFTYPDGIAAVQLGKRYGVPVVITEHIPWNVWDGKYAGVRQMAAKAARECVCHISVSESARRSVEQWTGGAGNLQVVPNGVDGCVFGISQDATQRNPNEILFVGAVRPVKGVDVLLRALRLLVDSGRDVHLNIVGEAFYDSYQKEESRLRQMAADLNLDECVRFLGKKVPPELGACIQSASVLVLPSRMESFGMVLVEALACGTPVVATRCGGPEDIVNEQVGVLTPPDDPAALARGIEHVLDHGANYDPVTLRAYALEKFGLESVGRRMAQIYEEAVRSAATVKSA